MFSRLLSLSLLLTTLSTAIGMEVEHYGKAEEVLVATQEKAFSVKDLLAIAVVPPAVNSAGVLDLSHMGLTSLDGLHEIPNINQVKVLSLQYNRLRKLTPGIFKGLTALKQLFLYENKLSELPSDIFEDLTALEKLSLNSNHLTTLPYNLLVNLRALKALDLGSNKLNALPNNIFCGLYNLQVLNIFYNCLTTLPNLEDLVALEVLMLSHNGFTISDGQKIEEKVKKITPNCLVALH